MKKGQYLITGCAGFIGSNLVKKLYKKIPIFGVCLGHQIIGQVFGSKIIQAKKLMHGKVSKIISKKI